jgi:hypothetical protein
MKRVTVMFRTMLLRHGYLLALAAILLSSLSVNAGDKIVFGDEKSKLNPEEKSLASKEASKTLSKMSSDPLKDVMTFQPQRSESLDPRKEKERKLKRLEQMNWMFVEEGDLTGKNDGKFSGKSDDDPSSILDKDSEKDIMFRGVFDKNGQGSKNNGQGGKKDKNPQSRALTSYNDNAGSGGESGSSLFSSPKKSETKSMHTDDALSFNKLFDTTMDGSGASAAKSDANTGSLFRSGAGSSLSSGPKNSRDDFKSFLSGSDSYSSGAAKSAENSRISGASSTPVFPTAADSVTRTPGMDPYAANSRAGDGMQSQSGWNSYGGVSGYGTLQPANVNTRSAFSSSTFEPNRAHGMGTLGGH